VPAHAYIFSGTRLVELMREYEKSQAGNADVLWGNLGRFEGYVIGVCDSFDRSLAIPDRTSYDQVVAGVAKYVRAHPQLWNLSAYDLVKRALFETFPRR
jgi:hypothetical protein